MHGRAYPAAHEILLKVLDAAADFGLLRPENW